MLFYKGLGLWLFCKLFCLACLSALNVKSCQALDETKLCKIFFSDLVRIRYLLYTLDVLKEYQIYRSYGSTGYLLKVVPDVVRFAYANKNQKIYSLFYLFFFFFIIFYHDFLDRPGIKPLDPKSRRLSL